MSRFRTLVILLYKKLQQVHFSCFYLKQSTSVGYPLVMISPSGGFRGGSRGSLEPPSGPTLFNFHGAFQDIRITCPCNVYPLKPHFYIVKLGYAGVYLFFLFLLQNIDCGYSLEPPRRGGSNVYPQSLF